MSNALFLCTWAYFVWRANHFRPIFIDNTKVNYFKSEHVTWFNNVGLQSEVVVSEGSQQRLSNSLKQYFCLPLMQVTQSE